MTDKWIRDTGLVMALLCLLLGYSGNRGFLVASGVLVALTLLVPKAIYPLAWIWLKAVFVLNLVVPKAFFGLVFCTVIIPVGLVRKLMKRDALLVSGWKSAETAFWDRGVKFEKQHLETPY